MFNIVCALHLRSESAKALRECKSFRDFVRMGYNGHKTEPIHQQCQIPQQAYFLYKNTQNLPKIHSEEKKSHLLHVTKRQRFPLIKAQRMNLGCL